MTYIDLCFPNDLHRRLRFLSRLERDTKECEHSLLRRRQQIARDEPDPLDIRLLCDIPPDAQRHRDDLVDQDQLLSTASVGADGVIALASSGVSGSSGCLNGGTLSGPLGETLTSVAVLGAVAGIDMMQSLSRDEWMRENVRLDGGERSRTLIWMQRRFLIRMPVTWPD